jgi:hypothetical protein
MSLHKNTWQLLSVLSLGALLAAATPARAESAARTGKMFAGGSSAEGVIWANRSLKDRVDAIGYKEDGPLETTLLPWEGGPKLRVPEDLEEGFKTLHFNDMTEAYFRPDPEERRQPGHDFQRSLLGVTGLLTLPNSFVLAPGVWSAGVSYQTEKVGAKHWTEIYQSQDNQALKGYLSRGFHGNVEAGIILHYQDSDILYQNQGTNSNRIRFRDDFTMGGVNFKAAIPYYDLWVSAGFSFEFFNDDDRDFLDLRVYDNLSTAFVTISDSGPRWDASIVAKFIQYANNGRRPPVGTGGIQQGYSPTTKWNQLGMGLEYGKWGGLSTILEWTQRHRIDFVGTAETEMNYGLKYETQNWIFKGFTLRQNTDDSENYGVSLSGRF